MKQKRFFPVLHCENVYQVRKNIDIIREYSDGVFLINHNQMENSAFYRLIEQVVYHEQKGHEYMERNQWLVGINDLSINIDHKYLFDSISLRELIKILEPIENLGISMLWVDNVGCDMTNDDNKRKLLTNQYYRLQQLNCEFFGGIHFKYQPTPALSLQDSLELFSWTSTNRIGGADKCFGVATLSGPATGQASEIERIKNAHKICDSFTPRLRLALASGVNSKNLPDFFPYVNDFLVASSLLQNGTNDFDRGKINGFMAIWDECLHKFNRGEYNK